MKVLVCGDRHWTNPIPIRTWLSKLQDWGYTAVIEGEAEGADLIASEEAERLGMTVLPFPADWARYGRAAGPVRNQQMLDEKPDLVLAFHPNISKSKGTANMIEQADAAGVKVILEKE